MAAVTSLSALLIVVILSVTAAIPVLPIHAMVVSILLLTLTTPVLSWRLVVSLVRLLIVLRSILLLRRSRWVLVSLRRPFYVLLSLIVAPLLRYLSRTIPIVPVRFRRARRLAWWALAITGGTVAGLMRVRHACAYGMRGS